MTQPRLLGGRYELDGVIGRGGMAEVYRARDLRLDRVVAVKTLRSDMARDPTSQARFRREAQSAASLNHPSVIAVYDTGEDKFGDTPVPYIVMEYVEGHTLRDLLQQARRLRPEKAMEIVDGILRALDYSHRGGIIHRDIKPANVMLTREHEVKVMDFGIARAMDDSAATMTQTAQVIGTAQYLSPEQARGERVDARSDVYSTGCVLYELLTGRPPFQGDSPVSIAYQHVREDPIPPSQLDPQIPPWADAIVLRAMAKSADDRYQSTSEMRADIQRALQGQPVSAAATMAMSGTQVMSAAPPARTQMQRPVNTGYDLPPVRYDEDERDGSGKKAAIWLLVAVLILGGAALIGIMLTKGNGDDSGKGQQIAVPKVVGLDQGDAVKAIEDAGLKSDIEEVFDDSVADGKVISTDPKEGEEISADETVTLTVSKGKEVKEVEVPDVRGQPAQAAKAELLAVGFKVVTRTQPSTSVLQGMVIRTSPNGGGKAEEKSTVIMYVSSGPQETTVPGVVGLQKNDAVNQLKDAKLRVEIREVPPEGDVPEGTVFRQSPDEGQKVRPGTTVVIYVAKAQQQPPPGPEPTITLPGQQ
ncbi:Stk1 family PASTA domain-containing Ser/Thr kinase [Actinomadura sp. HBU206391]|uniref:Stk1 family PASTA domain-containing Ser/Thr kinase n=1 Tax=Actinomadura sp. HBU206391 TaxID=2731692 RepID=UPI00164EF265|nr:Stk1 family PASTA domain-containing Ser/Thr kinase [Actinomadura sp. HBU206391]MBC6457168.1 Stk1 family PASTA domain-containing Ser/Thr kinase [Actinomadura sp. HBU206391]